MSAMRNHVVVITGASSGFGRGAALKFAQAGANLVLGARRKRLLKEVAQQCRKYGVEALAIEADVSDPSDVQELASQAIEQFGGIDVWVNNAGVSAVGRFEEAPLKEHEQVIRTNLLGTMYGSHAALRQFRKQGRGVLINVSSFTGRVAAPYLSSYSASKFGIRGLGMALRQELGQNGEDGIHVCTVMPVSMDTPFFEHAANHTGKPVRPIPPVYDPQKVVDVIYELAIDPQDEVVVGGSGKFGRLGERFAPKLAEKRMGRHSHQVQMDQEETAAEHSGSIFRPMKSGTDVYGGWRKENKTSKIAASLAVPAAMGIAYLALNRARARREWPRAA